MCNARDERKRYGKTKTIPLSTSRPESAKAVRWKCVEKMGLSLEWKRVGVLDDGVDELGCVE